MEKDIIWLAIIEALGCTELAALILDVNFIAFFYDTSAMRKIHASLAQPFTLLQDTVVAMDCTPMFILLMMQSMIWYDSQFSACINLVLQIVTKFSRFTHILWSTEIVSQQGFSRKSRISMLLLWTFNWWCYNLEGSIWIILLVLTSSQLLSY